MARLGSRARPAVVRVATETRAREILAVCDAHGWQVIVGVEPDAPEDLRDVRTLLATADRRAPRTDRRTQ